VAPDAARLLPALRGPRVSIRAVRADMAPVRRRPPCLSVRRIVRFSQACSLSLSVSRVGYVEQGGRPACVDVCGAGVCLTTVAVRRRAHDSLYCPTSPRSKETEPRNCACCRTLNECASGSSTRRIPDAVPQRVLPRNDDGEDSDEPRFGETLIQSAKITDDSRLEVSFGGRELARPWGPRFTRLMYWFQRTYTLFLVDRDKSRLEKWAVEGK